jgi:hypothetical protein
MKGIWKELLKFLSGAFFVTAGASWYLSWYHIAVPFAFLFLWIYYDVSSLFGHSWLYPFRSVFNLLLLRLREAPGEMLSKRDALARRNECHCRRWLFAERRSNDNEYR